MSGLKPLVEKEVKDLLRDPRIYIGLIIPIIMLPLMGLVISAATSGGGASAAGGLKIAIIDYDKTNTSRLFVSLLENMELKILEVNNESLVGSLEETKASGAQTLLVIPQGFEENILSLRKAGIKVYSIMESVGIGSMMAQSAVDRVLDVSSEILSSMLISKLAPGVKPEVVRAPLNVTRYTVVKDRIVEVSPKVVFGQLMIGYGIMVPLILLVLSITVTQMAATATAIENEEKTLETLLTFPVSRYKILMAKLLGSSIIAVLGGVIFTGAFLLYFQGFLGSLGLGIGAENLMGALPPPPLEAYLLLATSLILSIFFITSLGIIIGALSSDVRMSASLLGIVIVPVLIPSFFIMYGDPRILPLSLRLLIYILPTSYPMIMSKEMVISTVPPEVIYGIPYSAALTLILIYVTSKLLAPEKLLTLQYRLKLRRATHQRKTKKRQKLA